MDRINIKNLEVFAKHGLSPEENILGQKFVISASLYLDLRNAGITGDLNKSVDYSELSRAMKVFVEETTFGIIESVAELLAEKILSDYVAVQRIWLEVKKPWAPVAVHLDTVSVEIERCRHKTYIALGSNMGNREANLDFGITELARARGCRIINVSNFIETAPYGYTEQPDFVNGCLELETLLPPVELLDLLQDIENRAGREHTVAWGPRTLDLDIIFYDDIVFTNETLQIPHSQVHKREFVLTPLMEIAPEKIHPVFMKTVTELLEELKEKAEC